MYFCPQCYYSFDIVKATDGSNKEDTRVVLKKPSDAIKKVELDLDMTQFKADFKLDDLEKNTKYKKLSEDKQELLKKLFEESSISYAEFKCNNCNFIEPIKNSILLYQYDVDNNNEYIRTKEENMLACQNPILPRTHDYICKNEDCPTNKDKKISKEAVFFRDNNSFKINYICCICLHNW